MTLPRDIRRIFVVEAFDCTSSANLVGMLIELDDSGWAEWPAARGGPVPRGLSVGEMARLLRKFGIR